MNYYAHKNYGSLYTQKEYILQNKERFERKYQKEIEPRLDEIRSWLDRGDTVAQIVKRLHTSNQVLMVYRQLYSDFGEMFTTAIERRKAHDTRKFTYTPPESKETLCWRCNNIVPNPRKNKGCEWSVEDKPVPGWDATETRIAVYGRDVVSYCVHRCPKFKRLERGEQ